MPSTTLIIPTLGQVQLIEEFNTLSPTECDNNALQRLFGIGTPVRVAVIDANGRETGRCDVNSLNQLLEVSEEHVGKYYKDDLENCKMLQSAGTAVEKLLEMSDRVKVSADVFIGTARSRTIMHSDGTARLEELTNDVRERRGDCCS